MLPGISWLVLKTKNVYIYNWLDHSDKSIEENTIFSNTSTARTCMLSPDSIYCIVLYMYMLSHAHSHARAFSCTIYVPVALLFTHAINACFGAIGPTCCCYGKI